jgi:alkylresorcinol/alkylpyrone synthase
MTIVSVGSAFPENLYPQQVITDALKQHWGERLLRPALFDRFHARAGVRQRYLAFPLEKYEQLTGSWGEANRAWMEASEQIGERAIDRALERAGLERADLDALYIVSVTGVASPSLDARLINRMKLRPDLKRTPIFGLGCVGGAVGLTRAADYVRAFPDEVSAILAVEICSLTIQPDDLSDVNLVATALFSDGAAAAILAGAECRANGPEIVSTQSVFYPNTEHIMGWDVSEKGFSIVLSRELPDLIRHRLGGDLDAFLARHELTRAAIGSWVVHPGGPKIIDAVEDSLGLTHGELNVTRECLAEVGNFSSGSVLRVLEEVMVSCRPAPGTPGVILAMGPGFCAELLLVRW